MKVSDDFPLRLRCEMVVVQDGAPSPFHNATQNIQILKKLFPGGVRLPLRGPDFYLWDKIKDIVHSSPVADEAGLQSRVANRFDSINRDEWKSAAISVIRSCRSCLGAGGYHLGSLARFE